MGDHSLERRADAGPILAARQAAGREPAHRTWSIGDNRGFEPGVAMAYLHQIDPIALQLGPLGIHWYGIMYLLGFAAAWWLGLRRVKAGRAPCGADAFGDLMFYAMLGVIVGGRLGYMLVYGADQWMKDPLALLRVWEGGMSFHGGLVGVLVAGGWWARRNRIAFWDVVDFLAPLVPPGLGFGRLGNFIGGELYGKPTGAEWGVVFPSVLPQPFATMSPDVLRAAFDAGQLAPFLRHPSQLYQALWEGVLMFAVLWWLSSKPRARYVVSGAFAILYGIGRFLLEFVRVPDEHLGYLAFGWLTMGQVLTVPLVAVGVVLMVVGVRRGARA
jgi:phosphatidylglycerol:prolipoprotein diacylglycerol transferase